MPDLIKTEEIVRGSSDVPVKKKLKILNVKGGLYSSPFCLRHCSDESERCFLQENTYNSMNSIILENQRGFDKHL